MPLDAINGVPRDLVKHALVYTYAYGMGKLLERGHEYKEAKEKAIEVMASVTADMLGSPGKLSGPELDEYKAILDEVTLNMKKMDSLASIILMHEHGEG